MKHTEARNKFKTIRMLAKHLADTCDFVTAEKIGKAHAAYGENFIIVCATFKDPIERAQSLTAFTYGATVCQLSLHTSTGEDTRCKEGFVITISIEF
jgi:drug/metabolite transporter superfamily protein YnfA